VETEKSTEKEQIYDGLKSGILRAFILALIFAASLYLYTELITGK
jgi:hypothetical protein